MSPKKSTSKPLVTFGEPVADLPEARPGGKPTGGAPHWVKIATHAKENPGAWHPVRIPHLTIAAHSGAVSNINATSLGKSRQNAAFAEPGYRAAYREGTLYIRYDAPAESTNVRKIGA